MIKKLFTDRKAKALKNYLSGIEAILTERLEQFDAERLEGNSEDGFQGEESLLCLRASLQDWETDLQEAIDDYFKYKNQKPATP